MLTINQLYQISEVWTHLRICVKLIDNEATEQARLEAKKDNPKAIYCTQYKYMYYDGDDIEDEEILDKLMNAPIIDFTSKDNKVYFVLDGNCKELETIVF